MKNSELIEKLEKDIKENGPLLLWDGVGAFPENATRGLSLIGGRSLKEAIEVMLSIRRGYNKI